MVCANLATEKEDLCSLQAAVTSQAKALDYKRGQAKAEGGPQCLPSEIAPADATAGSVVRALFHWQGQTLAKEGPSCL